METTATAGVEEAGVAKPEDRQGKDEEVVTKQDNQGEQENDENGEVNADEDRGYDEMESMCMACGENGTTRLLMHKVPHFRELILASFTASTVVSAIMKSPLEAKSRSTDTKLSSL
jgi:pyruvate/2-oxoacid:ferredoxin oxidoreductase beta subunit